jgi:hypothetical protein
VTSSCARRLIIVGLVLTPFAASAQTAEFLHAPKVKSQVRVELSPITSKDVLYVVDRDVTPRALGSDSLFLTSRSIYVTVRRPNPLRQQVTATISDVADPSYGVMSGLMDQITSLASVVRSTGSLAGGGAGQPVPPTNCDPVNKAATAIADLDDTLYGSSTSPAGIKASIAKWIKAIDDAYATGEAGPDAIKAGAAAIGLFANTEDALILRATALINDLDTQTAASPPIVPAPPARGAPPPPAPPVGAPTPTCMSEAYYLYHLERLSNPRARLQQLIALKKATTDLQASVQAYAGGVWLDSNGPQVDRAVSAEIVPTPDKGKHVVVTVSQVAITGDDASGLFTVTQQVAASTAFDVRQFSLFAVEAGTGAVFSTVVAPSYGTTTDSLGRTIVGPASTHSVAITPGVLANYVCRCGFGPFLAPMLQVGVTTSTTTPAIFYGGGIRLFRVSGGDVALGGGWVQAWAKDLSGLKPGDVVTGTADITAHLTAWTELHRRPYFVIQVKF